MGSKLHILNNKYTVVNDIISFSKKRQLVPCNKYHLKETLERSLFSRPPGGTGRQEFD